MSRVTPQTLDPLGGLTARFFLITTVVIAAGSAVLLLVRHPDLIANASIQGVALVALAAAAVQAILGADPRFFPFGRHRHALLQVTMLIAAGLDAASRNPGADQLAVWGPTCVALFYVMMGSFRPAAEVVVFAIGSATIVGVVTVISAGSLAPGIAVEHLMRGIVPILAVGAGAAAFSHVLVQRLLSWQAEHDATPVTARTVAASEVQRDRLDFVDYRVGPFLEGLIESDSLTPVDAARARGLAASLRQQMLRDASRPWIVDIVDTIEGDPTIPDALSLDQRRALGAIIAEVRSAPGFVPGSVAAVVRPGPPVTISIEARADRGGIRAAAHRAVLGATFGRARVDAVDGVVSIALQVDR